MNSQGAQFHAYTEELQQNAIVEETMRVMQMRLEATNAELVGALVQKALPPGPEETPEKARWWHLLW